jgi:S1-C subfamily serine protease
MNFSRLALIVVVTFVGGCPRCFADVDTDVLAAQEQRIAVVAKASHATVAVYAGNGQGGGSAVLMSANGFALTNFHVTAPSGTAMKCGLDDGKLYDAVIVGIDPTGDLAMIRLLGRDDFPFASLADSDAVEVGDPCYAIGNPLLLSGDFSPSVSLGLVSGTHRYQYPEGSLLEYTDCLQVDAAVNPGNSGGPLFDGNGEIIGINGRCSFEKRGRVNVGVGYAISSNQIKLFLAALRGGRLVDHATLGARFTTSAERRVVVQDVLESSAAFRRGLRYGDELISFAGRPIHTVNGFKNVLGIYPAGAMVALEFRQRDRLVNTYVRLPSLHRESELPALAAGEAPRPKKRPGRKNPEQPPEPDREKPGDPGHDAQEALGATEKLPDIVAKHFAARPGFVNYYFNQQEQARIWNKFKPLGDFSSLRGEWTLGGTWQGDQPVAFNVSDELVKLTAAGGTLSIALSGKESVRRTDPPGSGGLLLALGMWRRLLTHGLTDFGDVTYLGDAARLGWEERLDVLSGTFAGVATEFFFDPSTGQLVLIEMFASDDDDPCQITCSDYREMKGVSLPHRLDILYGEKPYQAIQFAEINLTAKEPSHAD